MAKAAPPPLGEALATIERTILPSLSGLLDELIDAAALARPGTDAEPYAAELRSRAEQVAALTRLVEAVARAAQAPSAQSSAPRRMSA